MIRTTHTLAPALSAAAGCLALLLAATALLLAATSPAWAQADGPSLSIDAGPEGNGPTSIATIQDCVSAPLGAQFEIDVVIRDVEDLLAWEMELEYDPAVVIVVDHDVRLFQGANPGSAPIDLSARVPDDSGYHSLSAVESSDPPAVDSGSGVLARVTLEAVGEGESPLRLGDRDINEDGTLDRGTLLKNVDAEVIGDETGDSFFDGPRGEAIVVVGNDCPAGSSSVSVEGSASSNGSGFPWLYVAGAIVAALAVSGLGWLLLLSRRKSSAGPSDTSGG